MGDSSGSGEGKTETVSNKNQSSKWTPAWIYPSSSKRLGRALSTTISAVIPAAINRTIIEKQKI